MGMTRTIRLLLVTAVVAATTIGEGAALLLPDLAVRETREGLQVFLADPERGVLRGGVVPDTGSIAVATLGNWAQCGPLNRPTAIAIHRSKLVVVQAAPTPAIIECDLDGREGARVLLSGEPLRMPASVAVASDGTIAVLDRALRAFVLVRPDGKPAVVRATEMPLMLRADDRGQLYVADGQARGIVPVDLDDKASSAPYAQKGSRGATAVVPLQAEPAAFAVHKDVFYVADVAGGGRVQLAGGRLSLEVPDIRPRPAAIAVSRNYMVTVDREGANIDVADRPLPASAVIDPTEGNPNEAWVQLLEYVASRRMLPRNRVKLSPDDRSYEDVLRRNGVLVKVDVNHEKVALAPGRTKGLFCVLNPNVCQAGFSPEMGSVVIPQAAPQAVLHTESTSLDGKDVRTLVDERVLLESQKREVTDAYIAARNPTAGAMLETELLRRKMVLATPMNERLKPGTIIRIADGREIVEGELSTMCPGLNAESSKTGLPSLLHAPRVAVPSQIPSTAPRVRLSVGGWTRESISMKALEGCRSSFEGRDRYVIAESIAATDLRFETPPEVRRVAPARQAAALASVPVPGPLYVGYKPVPLSTLSAGLAVPVVDLERFKPIVAEPDPGLWSRREGSFTLPVTRWLADVLLPARDFYSSQSALAKLQVMHRSIDLSPRERLDRAAFSEDHLHWVDDPEAAKKIERALTDARTGLISAIKYDDTLASASGTEDVVIGVVEDSGSVDLDHAGFASGDESAWFDFVDGTGLQPHRPRTPASAKVPLALEKADSQRDHGTHVAGIIAARPTAVTLGLLPKTKLFLVPSDSMADLKSNIQTARDQLVFLFNMSLGFKQNNDAVIEDLHTRISTGWSDALFVIAAGNGGVDLNAAGALAPVSWATTLPNVMTVAASDETGENVLGQHTDPNESQESRGSNFGSRFVDLLAPGKLVHSLGRNGYAYACGSSQAAPQVTATAAMLWNEIRTPEVLRARMIYTADWKEPQFDRKVWGGRLNVRRAVFFPRRNVLYRLSETTPHELKLEAGATIKIDGDAQLRDGSTAPFRDNSFPFNRILRVAKLPGGRFRIVLLARTTDALTIVEGNATGSVKCKSLKRFDRNTQQFSLDPEQAVNCQQGISIGQFEDYTAGTPTSVRFQ